MPVNYTDRRYGLYILTELENGSTPTGIASKSYQIYSNPDYIMSNDLREKVYSVMLSEAGDEFALSKDDLEQIALKLIIKEQL